MALRIFHSADWHFGKMIGNLDRTGDFEKFLDTFIELVDERKPDVLLLAGDIFDTSLPGNNAQKLYYSLIHRLQGTSVRQIVITAGNHDSQRFLEAPRALLETMNCFIAGETPEEQVCVVRDSRGVAELGIAAVPYLREADVRRGSSEYSDQTRAALFEAGVKAHYEKVSGLLDAALDGAKVPRIAMGHLFVIGAEVRPGVQRPESEGLLNVGSLNSVSAAAFGEGWDYVALGHIHHAQTVSAAVPMQYAGAPIGLTFNHRKYSHSIVEIDLSEDGTLDIHTVPVRQPRQFVHCEGSMDELIEQIREAGRSSPQPYVEAVLSTGEDEPLLSERLAGVSREADVLLISVRNEQAIARYMKEESELVELTALTPQEVFRHYLSEAAPEISEESAEKLKALLSQAEAGVAANHWPLGDN